MNLPKEEKKVYCTDCKVRLDKKKYGIFEMPIEGVEFQDGWKCVGCFKKVK
jgi:hypothetical protein